MPAEHPPEMPEIEYASQLPEQSDEWLPFITKVLKLDPWMVPAVRQVVVRTPLAKCVESDSVHQNGGTSRS